MSDPAATPLLTVDIDPAALIDGEFALVRCHGKLVAGCTGILHSEVRKLIPDTKRIVLDLADLTHMDSMGVGAVVRLYVSAKSAGCDLKLINLGPRIEKVLGITNLLSVFARIGESEFPIS